LAQLLFYENGTVYNQTLIMNSNYEVDPALVAEQGLPFYAGTWIINLLSMNLVCQELLLMYECLAYFHRRDWLRRSLTSSCGIKTTFVMPGLG
jgi:hypothetical protein